MITEIKTKLTLNAVQRHQAKNRARGLCQYCPSPVETGFVVCPYHREKRRAAACEAYLRRKARKKAAGLCLFCAAPGFAGAGAETLLCGRHRAASRSYYYGSTPRPVQGPSVGALQYLQYPYVGSENRCAEGVDLLLTINQVVPKYLPESVRAEACQDLALAILDGSIELAHLAAVVPAFVRAVDRRYPTKFGPRSLDQSAFRGSKILLHEVLAGRMSDAGA